MKNSILKWYMFAFLFLGNFIMFAQTTNPGDESGCTGPDCPDLEGDGDTPINSKLVYLGILAVVFAYFYFKSNSQKKVRA